MNKNDYYHNYSPTHISFTCLLTPCLLAYSQLVYSSTHISSTRLLTSRLLVYSHLVYSSTHISFTRLLISRLLVYSFPNQQICKHLVL
jgi:hypothetical protein